MNTPLTGPNFGSYTPDEVSWLLTDYSNLALEESHADRERDIQSGIRHYAESLPVEFQPNEKYQKLFNEVLVRTSDQLATAVGVLTERVLADRGADITLVSLARAGTPIGILMRRWAARKGLQLPHYSLSIVRERGIDTAALNFLGSRHDPKSIVFVDGWTGKGAITCELKSALDAHYLKSGVRYNSDLAVLADPGSCVRTFGTREDFLIASACLNSTVSGLISRTVLNPRIIAPGQFHGAKFYRHLQAADRSAMFLDAVSSRFDCVEPRVRLKLSEYDAEESVPTWAGLATVRRIQQQYGISSANFVKPGIGETTRVLLRRAPAQIILRDPQAEEHRHIRLLAEMREVPIVFDRDLAYSCVGLIREVSM